MYKGGKLLYTIDKAKQLLDEKYKKLEEENKKIKIGETKSMIGKEIVINSVNLKKRFTHLKRVVIITIIKLMMDKYIFIYLPV